MHMAKSTRGHQERLKAIETLLLWEGQVSRPRLGELFDIHGTNLSKDMAAYAELVPGNCCYETGVRAYVLTSDARPQLSEGKFHEYESLVGTMPAEGLRAGVELLTTEQHATAISYRPFSRIHAAIREGKQLSIEYRSLGNPDRHQRTIRPHAFIQAGPRWHLRAYCEGAEAFRDFNLGRISRVLDPKATSLPGPEADIWWNTKIELRLVPHPELTSAQSRLVRDEYMGRAAALVFEAKQAVAKYIVRNYGAATNVSKEHPPQYLLAVDKPEALPPSTFI